MLCVVRGNVRICVGYGVTIRFFYLGVGWVRVRGF